MNWERVIRFNHEALLTVVMALFATVGIAPGGSVNSLPRKVRSAVLLALRPAEPAARRIIVMVARNMALPEFKPRPAPAASLKRTLRSAGQRVPPFRLIDPRKDFVERPRRAKFGPQIMCLWDDSMPLIVRRQLVLAHAAMSRSEPPPLSPDDLVSTQPGKGSIPPLRPGHPPGYRQRHVHPVDQILKDCHYFAWYRPETPET